MNIRVTFLLAAGALACSLWLAGRFPGLLLYTPPIVINLALCVIFARTLRRGHEPRRWVPRALP